MNAVQRIKDICKERKIAISKLEKDLGFANGYIGQLKKGTMPADRLKKVSDYLDVSIDYLMTGIPDEVIADRLEAFEALVDYIGKLEYELIEVMKEFDTQDTEELLCYAKTIAARKRNMNKKSQN